MDPIQKTQNDSVSQINQTGQNASTSGNQAPVAPSAPVGTVQKEQGPVAPTVLTSEFVKPSESEPQISKELKDIGVEAVSHIPNLNQEHQEAGVWHAKETVPVSTEPSGMVQLPMTQTKAQSVVKTFKVTDSIKWLATLILKLLKSEIRNPKLETNST